MSALSRLAPLSFSQRVRRADHLILATALLRSGFTPFLALFLHGRGLGATSIGAVLAFGSLVGLVATIPGGVLVDQTRGRPVWLMGAGLLALGAPLLLMQAQNLVVLLCAVAMMALSEAVVAPTVLVMNLDSVPPGAVLDRLGRNQAVGHAGRVAGLTLSGMVGSSFGFSALIAFEGLYLLLLLLMIWRTPPSSPSPARALDASLYPGTNLILLGVTLGLFQVGNAALSILLGLSLAEESRISPPLLASSTAMIAQTAMIGGSLLVIPALRRWGYWPVLASSFAILPLRCALAAFLPASVALLPVEILHGLGESLQLVTIGNAIGDLQRARGRPGTLFGCVMLLQGLGSAASPLLGGYVAERWTGTVAYSLLGGMGLLALGFWILCRRHLTNGLPKDGFRLA